MSQDQLEAEAMMKAAKKACEEVVSSHLDEWLETSPQRVRFEEWLEAVHPENCKEGVVDSRMYLEVSYHRQLWNDVAACASNVTPYECDCRHVPSSDVIKDQDGQLKRSDDEMAAVRKSAIPHLASALQSVAAAMRLTRHQADLQPLSESERQGLRLLAQHLGDSGPEFSLVARAASDLADGRVLAGTGLATLITRATWLSEKQRLRFVTAMCDLCPQVLEPLLPAWLRPLLAQSPTSLKEKELPQQSALPCSVQ